MDSIHGQALLKMGLIVAPSCDDCHGVHDIKRAVDRDSPINHANVARTCGKCHLGVEETYDQSIHGQLLAKGDPRGPVCTDCHTAHEIVNPEGNNFKAISDERCGKCHADRLAALPGHLPRQGHGAGQAQRRPGSGRLLRLPRLSRRAAAVRSAVASVQNQHSGHLPAMSSRRHHQLYEYRPARQSAGRETLSAAPCGVSGHDRPAHRHVRLLWPAHPRLAGARGLSLPARLEEIPRGENSNAGGRRMVHAFLAVRAVPAFPGRDELSAAGHHRHAAEILLHELGQSDFRRHRRPGNGAHAASSRRASSRSSTSACTSRR